MRKLRWMHGKGKKERISKMVGVALIEDKLRGDDLRWFGQV